MDSDRSAALVVRVWLEDGTRSFRGRLTSASTDPARPAGDEEATVALAASPEDVVEGVRAWLAGFLADAPGTIDTRGRALDDPLGGT